MILRAWTGEAMPDRAAVDKVVCDFVTLQSVWQYDFPLEDIRERVTNDLMVRFLTRYGYRVRVNRYAGGTLRDQRTDSSHETIDGAIARAMALISNGDVGGHVPGFVRIENGMTEETLFGWNMGDIILESYCNEMRSVPVAAATLNKDGQVSDYQRAVARSVRPEGYSLPPVNFRQKQEDADQLNR